MLIPHSASRYTYLLFLFICLSISITVRAQHTPNHQAIVPLSVDGGRAVQYVDGQFKVSTVLAGGKTTVITAPHRVAPYFCIISDDGRWLLYSIKTKTEKITYVHDLTRDGEMKQRYPFAIESAAFIRDGNKAFFVHSKTFWGAKLAAYDTRQWQLLAVRPITDLTTSITVNADGSQLLAAAGAVVREIDTETLETEKVHWETSRLRGLVYSPTDLRQYASINHKNRIEVRDLTEDRVVHTIHAGQGRVTRLAFAPDGRHLMSMDDAGHLNVWDLQERSRVMAMENITAAAGFEEGKVVNPPTRSDSAFLNGPTGKMSIVPIPIISYSPETSFFTGPWNGLHIPAQRQWTVRTFAFLPSVFDHAFGGLWLQRPIADEPDDRLFQQTRMALCQPCEFSPQQSVVFLRIGQRCPKRAQHRIPQQRVFLGRGSDQSHRRTLLCGHYLSGP